jgi:putative hemolysin
MIAQVMMVTNEKRYNPKEPGRREATIIDLPKGASGYPRNGRLRPLAGVLSFHGTLEYLEQKTRSVYTMDAIRCRPIE